MLLASSRVVSQLGDQLQFLALPLLVVAITGSAAQAGLVLGAQTLVFLFFGVYAGVLVDRRDRKRTMIWCDVGRGVLTATVPIAYLGDFLTMPLLYVVAIGNGVLATLFSAANSSALPNIVSRTQLPSALGALGAISNTLRIAGASVAGILYSLGRMIPFALNAVSFLLSAISLRFISARFQESEAARQPAKGPAATLADIREGLSWLWGRRVIRTLAFLDAGDALRYGIGYLLIITLAQRLDATATQVGIVFTGAAAGALLGNLLAPKLTTRFPLGRLSISTLWIEALAFPFYAIAPTWWLLLFVAFAESVISPVYNVALDTYRLGQTPDAMRGRVTSSVDTLVGGAAAIGTAVGGVAIDAFGPVQLTFVLTAWLVLLAVIATTSRTLRSTSVVASEVAAD